VHIRYPVGDALMQVGPIWQQGNRHYAKLQMYLTSPQNTTTISTPYTVSIAGSGAGYQAASPWEWQTDVKGGVVRAGAPHHFYLTCLESVLGLMLQPLCIARTLECVPSTLHVQRSKDAHLVLFISRLHPSAFAASAPWRLLHVEYIDICCNVSQKLRSNCCICS
jgi:hypothetical protein